MPEWIEVDIPTHPIAPARWVKTIAHIRENATGEMRRYEDHAILEAGEERPSDFMWTEGNYACDCNRALFFQYAIGRTYDEAGERDCGHGAFAVNVENPATGEIFYREFETDTKGSANA